MADGKQSSVATFDPDEFMKNRQGAAAPAKEFDPDEFMASRGESTETPTEETLPGSTPRLRATAKSFKPPTRTEKETPAIPENYGFTLGNVGKNIWEGAKGALGSTADMVADLTGLNAAREGRFNPLENISHLAHKYVIDPATEEAHKGAAEADKGNYVSAAGHGLAAALPVVGPWAAGLGEQAGTGDVGGATGQVLGQVGAGEALMHTGKVGELADKGARKLVSATGLSTAEAPAVAAQRAMKPSAKFAEKAQRDIAGAAPYLEGATNLKELQGKVKGAKAEVWHHMEDALERVGDNEVAAPKMKVGENGALEPRSPEEATVSLNDLEKERLRASAMLQKVRKLNPVDQQGILQKAGDEARLNEHYQDILSRLDPELEAAGIDPKQIRAVHGNLTGVEKLIQGKNTLTEADRAYGLGKFIKGAEILHPFRNLPLLKESVGDIAAGRPWFKGKPTDVAVGEGFNAGAGGEKPDFTRPVPPPKPAPVPFQAPEAAPAPPPTVEAPFRMEPTGTLGSVGQLGTRGRGGVSIAGLLPERIGMESTEPPPVQPQFQTEAIGAVENPELLGARGRGGVVSRTAGLLPERVGAPVPEPAPAYPPLQRQFATEPIGNVEDATRLGPRGTGGVRVPIKGQLPETISREPVETKIKGITAEEPKTVKTQPKEEPVTKRYGYSEIQDAEATALRDAEAMSSSDRPGVYFDEIESTAEGRKGGWKTGLRMGGQWRGVKSGRSMFPFMREHPEWSPETVMKALRNKDSAMYQRVIKAAIDFNRRTETLPETIGGEGHEGAVERLPEKIGTTPSWVLNEGDTFIDDKGEPRRVESIEGDKIKTKDGTDREYEGNIEHEGEVNSPESKKRRK